MGQSPENSADGDLPPIEEPDTTIPWVVVLGSFVMFAVVALLMYRAGLFDAPGNEAESNTLAAVLGLLGVLLTELLVGAGLLLKHSFDVRTYRLAVYEQRRLNLESIRDDSLQTREQERLEVEAQRAEHHKRIEQERLRQDTVLRAVELLSDDSGSADASPAQQVGAIRALVSLNEIELAVSLLDMLWSDPKSPKLPVLGALSVVDYVFAHVSDESPDMRQETANILQYNAAKLFPADDVLLPLVIREGGWLELPPPIALNLVLTVAKGSASTFPGLDPAPSENVRYVLSRLFVFATETDDRRNQLIAAHTAIELARSLPRGDVIMVGSDTLAPDVVEAQLREVIAGMTVPVAGEKSVLRLRRWADGLLLERPPK